MTLEPLEQTVRYAPLHPIILAVVLAGLYGCGDDVTDPDAFVESAEAEAVMQSARELPALPDLMERAGSATDRERAVFQRARELWAGGMIGDARDDSRRRLAVRYALPALVEAVPAEEWSAAREGVDRWVATAESLLDRLSLPHVEVRIARARSYLDRSDAVVADERRRSYYLLLAMSELVETTPRFVARDLVRAAGAALQARTAGTDGEEQSRVVERALRLKDWAEQAVAEGDYLLAIQRAYYAKQLVEEP